MTIPLCTILLAGLVTPFAACRTPELGAVGKVVPELVNHLWVVFQDKSSTYWFGSDGEGVYRCDGNSFTWVSDAELTELDDGPSFGVRGIFEYRDGRFWLSNTLYRYDVPPSDSKAQGKTAARFTKEKGIGASDECRDVDFAYFTSGLKDRPGVSWIATLGAGVWRCDGTDLTHHPVLEGTRAIWVTSIYEDHQGGLCLGTAETGAHRFDGQEFERFRPDPVP